jgi:enoyl-CoA hydratase/carnithine racemase
MNQVLTVTIEGQVALLTLNRPQKLNAMNNELVDVMLGCLDEIELDPRVRAVVITGAGRAFSAGGGYRGLSASHRGRARRGRGALHAARA